MTVSRDHYYKLASDLEVERIESAKSLLKELAEADAENEYKYALDRLIKGLSSSRASARIGFSTCLTELLSILILESATYTIEGFLQDLDQKIKASITKANGKNERAVLFGKLFGYQALLNSAVFTEDSFISRKSEFVDILCQIIDLSLSKSWIRETCFATIYQALKEKAIIPHVLENGDHKFIITQLLRKLDECNLTLSTEGLLIYLGISPSERAQLAQDAIVTSDKTWKEGNPLAKGNLATLSKVLKDTGNQAEGQDNKQQKGSWQPRLHYVWGLLINELLTANHDTTGETEEHVTEKSSSKKRSKSSPSKKSKKAKHLEIITFAEFWKAVIDEQFFSSNASPERKYLGFEIVRLTFKLVEDPDLIDSIFSKNFMRSLINQTAKDDRFLNKIAKLTLEDMESICLQNPKFRIPLLRVLLRSDAGSIHFDSLTKSKTCESIISKNSDVERENLLSFFVDWFNSLTIVDDLKKLQSFLIDQILLVVKTSTGEIALLLNNLFQVFVKFGYFIPADQDVEDDDSIYNKRVSIMCQDRLKSLLTKLSSHRGEDNVQISQVTEVFQKLEKDSDYKLRLVFDDELNTIKNDAIAILNQIKKFDSKNLKMKCFEILYSMTIIQLYSGDEDSISLIPELNVAFDKQVSDESSQSNEILMDILLTFISQKSVLMKQLSFVIWEFLINNGIKLENINLLIEILVTKENKDGQAKLFNSAGDEDLVEDDDEEDSHDHDHSSHEEEEEEEEKEEDKNDSDSSSDDDVSDDMEEVDLKTNMALAEALGIPTSESGEVKFDSDEDDSDEDEDSDVESMSDEQMLAIDSQLSTIFQQRKDAMDSIKLKSGNQRKLDVMDAKQNMVFFKNRILDLLEKFNELNNASYLNVYFVPPLLKLIELTLDKQLGEKAHKLLKNKICKSKIQISEADEIDELTLFSMIKEIQTNASQSSIKAHSLASNQASIFIAKVLVGNYDKEEMLNKIIDVYSDSLKAWGMDKSSKIQSTMFFDFVNWVQSKRL